MRHLDILPTNIYLLLSWNVSWSQPALDTNKLSFNIEL